MPFCVIWAFLETNILLTSMSSIVNSFLFFIEITFVDVFVIKINVLFTHSYTRCKNIIYIL